VYIFEIRCESWNVHVCLHVCKHYSNDSNIRDIVSSSLDIIDLIGFCWWRHVHTHWSSLLGISNCKVYVTWRFFTPRHSRDHSVFQGRLRLVCVFSTVIFFFGGVHVTDRRKGFYYHQSMYNQMKYLLLRGAVVLFVFHPCHNLHPGSA
jgi:hypothetical protein